MFWSTKKSKPEDDREKLLKEFKNSFPSVRRPNNDDHLFEIPFVVGGQYSSLRIFIPTDFPTTRPAAGPVMHPWLDQFKQVNGCNKLINWNPKTSSLVEVVEESLAALISGSNGPVVATQGSSTIGTNNIPNRQLPSTNSISVIPGPNANNGAAMRSNSYTNVNNPIDMSSYPAKPSVQNNIYPPVPGVNTGPNSGMSGQINGYHMPNNQVTIGYPNYPPANQYPSHNINQQYTQNNNNHQSNISYNDPNNNMYNSNPTNFQSSNASSSSFAIIPPNNIKSTEDPKNEPRSPINMPDIPQSFPDLEKLSIIQLERLNTDQASLAAHIDKISSVESMKSLRDQMRISNFENARNNLLLEDDINKSNKEYLEIQTKLKSIAQMYSQKLKELSKKYDVSKDSIIKELNNKCDKLDETSEDMGRSFVDGDSELSKFVQDYLDARIKYHSVKTKMSLI